MQQKYTPPDIPPQDILLTKTVRGLTAVVFLDYGQASQEHRNALEPKNIKQIFSPLD